MYLLEKRSLDRFKIAGSKVKYNTLDGNSAIGLVIDISKSSIRFEVTIDLEIGQNINLEIIIPTIENIKVKGQVTSFSNAGKAHAAKAVVMFAPFGTDERYNSTASYKQLSELIKANQVKIENPGT